MYANLISVVIAFLEGFALIISPCILPILPLILSASLTGKKTRPLGIILGFVVTFSIVTLFSRALVQWLHIDSETLRYVSLIILFLLGLVMVSTYLSDKFTIFTQGLLNTGSSIRTINNSEGGFFSGLFFGGLVGIIWTPCAGPILAAVIVQVVLQHTTSVSIAVVIAFAFGAALPMLFIALLGRKMLGTARFFRARAVLFRKLLGVIILLTVAYLAFFPAGFSFSISNNQKNTPITSLSDGLAIPYAAPNIAGITDWINSKPLQLSELKGKVVLIDFWTYSCINCLRTLPYLKDWYEKYQSQGLVIIGIHSPEFLFEHDVNNVKAAVKNLNITYPVALDNQFVTWRNYHNQYWPAHYLIDKNGNVVYTHFGEGKYDVTENNIRYLLGMGGVKTVGADEVNSIFTSKTAETYFGYSRAERFSSPELITKNAIGSYHYPDNLRTDHWALQGQWYVYPDKIVAASAGAAIKLHFSAKNVYAVMGAPRKLVRVQVKLNGKDRSADLGGTQLTVSEHKLYSLLNLTESTNAELELIALEPGLEMYTFTFG